MLAIIEASIILSMYTTATAEPNPHIQAAEHVQGRLEFLDALRAIAAVIVFLTHMLERVSPEFQYFRFTYFDTGSFGVTIFFLCSGFIIPRSLEPKHWPGISWGSQTSMLLQFWIKRFFRLYPLYWLSVLVFALCFVFEKAPAPADFAAHPAQVTLAHLTMVQTLFGVAHMSVVYWTLTFELVFYFVISLLFVAGVSRYTVPITVILIIASGLVEFGAGAILGRTFALGLVSFLIMMFTGTVLYRLHSGVVKTRTAVVVACAGLFVSVLVALFGPTASGDPSQFLYQATAWVAGYAVFGLAFTNRNRPIPQAVLYLGRISYSLYLLHPIVLILIPATPIPALTIALWIAGVVITSAITYRWVEHPAQQFGKRLTRNI